MTSAERFAFCCLRGHVLGIFPVLVLVLLVSALLAQAPAVLAQAPAVLDPARAQWYAAQAQSNFVLMPVFRPGSYHSELVRVPYSDQ